MQNQDTLALGQPSDSSAILPEITEANRVDARSLHEALEIASPFTMWIARRIEEYQFRDGEDFTKMLSPGGRHDYLLTLDMAKELAMVERNDAGRRVRRYFIDVEKKAREAYSRHRENGGGLGADHLARIGQINAVLIETAQDHAGRIAELERTSRPGPEWVGVRAWLAVHRPGRELKWGALGALAHRCTLYSGANGVPVGWERRGGALCRTYAPHVIATVVARKEARP